MNRTLTAVLLIAAAVLANVAFTVLGMVFNYPDVLKEPVEDDPRRLPRLADRRHGRVCRPRPVRGADGTHRHRRRPAVGAPGDAGRGPSRHCRRHRPGDRAVPLAAAGARLRRRRDQRGPSRWPQRPATRSCWPTVSWAT